MKQFVLAVVLAVVLVLLAPSICNAQSLAEREEKKQQEEAEARERAGRALQILEESQNKHVDKNIPLTVVTQVWQPSETCDPRLRHWIENANEIRMAELEKEIAFLYLLRDLLAEQESGREYRQLLNDTNRKIKLAFDEIEAIRDLSSPVIKKFALPLQLGGIGWFEAEVQVVDFRGDTEILAEYDGKLLMLNNIDNRSVATNSAVTVSGFYRIENFGAWQGTRVTPRQVNGISVTPTGTVRILQLQPVDIGTLIEHVDVEVPNPAHPATIAAYKAEDQARTVRIRMKCKELERSLNTPTEGDKEPSLEDRLKSLLRKKGSY